MMADISSITDRAGGVLLHPTSLPGPFGIGDLGPAARLWLTWLKDAGCRIWQVLPLGPTGYGDSPYQTLSAFAGNPLLVSPQLLAQDGLLVKADLDALPMSDHQRVDYGAVLHHKGKLLALAADRFDGRATSRLKEEFDAFSAEQAWWLEDYALFRALKDGQGGIAWTSWDPALTRRDQEAIEEASRSLRAETRLHRLAQFLFYRQWQSVRQSAHDHGITLIGDAPIFVAHDSADVWAHPSLFELDDSGNPTFVAGVPPDYFSPTGQRWGNPLYRWEAMEADGYTWWIQRFRAVLAQVDIVRLDHFRGFEAYWEIPMSRPTAEIGRWVPGPGRKLLAAVRDSLGALPIIAEDLGVITPEVIELRDAFGLPGMKVLQFAFVGDPEDPFLPHNFPRRCVVYTGTHDNDTTHGWYETAPQAEKDFCRRYLGRDSSDIAWDMIRCAWSSVAQWSIAPMQDLLSLGPEARMNFPGRMAGNWAWRMTEAMLTPQLAARMHEMNVLFGRARREAKERMESEVAHEDRRAE